MATGSLSVETDPAGASVVVDGQSWGVTPLAERTIAPGDHRVRVVKDGYLENSRVVTVQAGQAGRVKVSLTPDKTSAVREQRDPTATPPQGGGGGKKKLLIGLGVVAVGAGVYLATKEGNKAPTVGGVTASPTTGLQGATSISFSAQASDPNSSDTLTYEWNFGDGSTGSGASVTKTYTTSGTMAVTVTVRDPKGLSATGNTSVTVRSLSGTWRGNLVGSNTFNTVVTLTHTGAAFTGSYTDQIGPATITAGTVATPNVVRFSVNPPGFQPFTFAGTVSGDLNTISGTVNGSGFVNAPWSLSRQ